MGILDDAIRQHLELKRQHGAAEEDLRRQEEEALGPARRDVAPAPAAEDEAGVEHEEVAAEPVAAEHDVPQAAATELLDPETELLAEETALHDPADLHAEPGDGVPPPEPVPDEPLAPELAPSEPVPDEPFASEAPAVEPVPDEPPASGALPSEPLDAGELPEVEELREEDDPVAPDAPVEDDPEAEDVLEDTPDFLQETPEHDRLWFEQKPPRDFDFD